MSGGIGLVRHMVRARPERRKAECCGAPARGTDPGSAGRSASRFRNRSPQTECRSGARDIPSGSRATPPPGGTVSGYRCRIRRGCRGRCRNARHAHRALRELPPGAVPQFRRIPRGCPSRRPSPPVSCPRRRRRSGFPPAGKLLPHSGR